MASANAVRAGGAFIELFVKDTKLTQGLRAAQTKLSTFANTVRSIGAGIPALAAATGGIGAAIFGLGKIFADAGSEVHDMSQRTGLAADHLSELKYAAEQSGASLKDVEGALRFMAKQGIDVKRFDELAMAVSQIANESERAQVAMKLWGRGGTALLGMAGELPGLRAEARSLGVSMSPRQAALADDLGDSFGRLKSALRGLAFQLGELVAPSLLAITAALTQATQTLNTWAAALADSTRSMTASTASWLEKLALKGGGAFGARGQAGLEMLKWLQGKPNQLSGVKRRSMPDLSDLAGITEMRGGSSRGTFSGFRAENLAIGSGGGMPQKFDKMIALLEKLGINTRDTVRAVEDIDGLEFQ